MNDELLTSMLHLTADIAEGLLSAKDDGLNSIPHGLYDKIDKLHRLAQDITTDGSEVKSLDVKWESADSFAQESENTDALLGNHTDVESESSEAEATAEALLAEEEAIAKVIIREEPETNIDEAIDDAELAQSAEFEETEDANEADVDSSVAIESCNEVAESENIVAEPEDEYADTPHDVAGSEVTHSENHDFTEPVAENAEAEEVADALLGGPTARDLRRAMSLNDVFLFRRTLFEGSAGRMNEALEDISQCRSIAQVGELLRDRYSINLKQPESKSLMAILEPFFEI